MTGRWRDVRRHPNGAAALLIALVTLLLYGRTLAYGLVWDDYAALRPRAAGALIAAWTGPWDPGGVWPDFYRPLSLTLYDTLFRVWGHHATALHALNLSELFLAAWMLRAFVRRETGSDAVGLVAALALILHPETPSSLAAWISQQFQLAPLIVVIGTMLVWQRVRERGVAAWCGLLGMVSIGALFKEDVLLLAPALLAWQAIRAKVIGDARPVSRTLAALATGWCVLHVIARQILLGGIGGYGTPELGRLLLNAVVGPISTFGLQWIPSAHGVSLLVGVGVIALAALAWRGRSTAPASHGLLVLYGVALGLCANAPLVLVSGHTRMYLLILAATLTFTGAISLAAGAVRRHGLIPRAPVAAFVVWLVVIAAANWQNTNTFAPCAPETLQRDQDVLKWEIVAVDTRAAVREKVAACRAERNQP